VTGQDYFQTATALQAHERNVVSNYRREMAERFRQLADEAEEKALHEPEVIEQGLLLREASTWKWASAILDVHE